MLGKWPRRAKMKMGWVLSMREDFFVLEQDEEMRINQSIICVYRLNTTYFPRMDETKLKYIKGMMKQTSFQLRINQLICLISQQFWRKIILNFEGKLCFFPSTTKEPFEKKNTVSSHQSDSLHLIMFSINKWYSNEHSKWLRKRPWERQYIMQES